MVNYQEVGEQFLVSDPRQLRPVAEKIIQFAGDHKVWLFNGDMGAGKTTMIQAICQAKGVVDAVTSPTYTVIREYRDLSGEEYYHFDFYRLKDLKEALDIGCDEYFDSGNYCFIEWPDLVAPILPEKYITINIQVQPDHDRLIKVTKND